MAYDVQRFNQLTKQMSAYAHYTREEHLQLTAARARRREHALELAEQLNRRLRLRFRADDEGLGGRLRVAGELLDSPHPPIRPPAASSTPTPSRHNGSPERDQRLSACQPPGSADRRYRAAYTYAQRWRLEIPPTRSTIGNWS